MAYDDQDESTRSQNPVRQPSAALSLSYKTALAIWIVPAILAGMLMAGINLRSYDDVISINYEGGDDFLRSEQRIARGWPYVIASADPATKRWSLSAFGISINGIIALAAIFITAGTTRFVAAAVDDDVNDPIPTQVKQLRRLLRGKPKAAAKRSPPSGRLPSSGRMPASGPPRIRRTKRPADE